MGSFVYLTCKFGLPVSIGGAMWLKLCLKCILTGRNRPRIEEQRNGMRKKSTFCVCPVHVSI